MGQGVTDICLSYNTAHSTKQNKKTAKQNTGKQRGRGAQQKITAQSTLFHCINRSEIKQTNDSPFRLLSSFPPVKS